MAMTAESVRAAVWHAPEDVRIEEIPARPLGPGDVRVAVTAVGICGSDVHFFFGGHETRSDVAPFVMGHETAGVVVESGPGVENVRVGQRVTIEPGVPCGRCEQCRTGDYNLCPRMRFFADPPVDGSLATEVVIDANFVYPVPASMSNAAAALIEPAACAVAACRRAKVTVGSRVLITGAGPIGLLVNRVARAFGAASVTVTDINPQRLERARQDGADLIVDVRDRDLSTLAPEYDVLIECSGVASVASAAINLLRPHGIAALVGLGLGEQLTVPVSPLQNREVWVTGVFRYANAFSGALALADRLDLDSLVTHTFTLDEAEQALQCSTTDPSCIKAVVTPTSVD